MKKISFLALFVFTIIHFSCENNITQAEISYTKATAIYGDLNLQRSSILIQAPQEILAPGKIYVSDNMLLIGERNKGVHTFDNTNPENPQPLNFINIPFNNEFYVHESMLFVESLYDIIKIDISDIKSPQIEDRILDAFLGDLKNNEGEYVVGFDYEKVTEMVDVNSNVYQIRRDNRDIIHYDFEERLIEESSVPTAFIGSDDVIGTFNKMAYAHGHLYVINDKFLTVIDDLNGFNFVSVEEIGRRMEMIYPQDDALFIGTDRSMEIYDLFIPSQPHYKSAFQHAPACDPVLPDGDVAYVTLRNVNNAEEENVLLVIDIKDKENPIELQEIPMLSPFGMTKIGEKLFVAEGHHGVKIFDISDQESIEEIEHISNVTAFDVIPHHKFSNVILIANPTGISQYRFESDNHFTLLSTIDF